MNKGKLATALRIAYPQLNNHEAAFVAREMCAGSEAIAAGWLLACASHTRQQPTIKVGTLEGERRSAESDPLLAAVLSHR